ncbi:uncharacterized protein RSE6_08376 [Rhynchosporium secalis]|uniref:RAI1-like domain-containing protein n=1 Tax=Rhynchosporium secalis TaxID=38038 RepID=A0A1E1MGE2_RHYSE|nr:uncharacterized protein RSE6_08376 [Rhynchosporium secalis]
MANLGTEPSANGITDAKMALTNEPNLGARLDSLSLQQISDAKNFVVPARRNRPGHSRDDRMLWGTSNLISKIHVEPQPAERRAGIGVEASAPVTIQNYKYVASYNWKDIEHPTIYVPGLSRPFPRYNDNVHTNPTAGIPPKFTPPSLPIQLQKDNSTRSSARSPAAPVDPLFQAILHEHPDFDMSSIDIVTTRRSLRDLLDFASCSTGKWRIDIDMVHNTMFINQWEEFRLMLINGRQNSEYGHTFEDSVVNKEAPLEDSLNHERIVEYELGGLRFLVRFEADAYLEDDDSETREPMKIPLSDPPAPKPSPVIMKPPYKLVHVISRGRNVDPELIIELKSCSRGSINMGRTVPQLWFSQTKHLGVGYHKDGLVTRDLNMREMTEKLDKWEADNQKHLKSMIHVIKSIRDIARTGERKLTVVCSMVDGLKCLSIYRRTGRGMTIRPEVVAQCWKNSSTS